MMYGTPGGMVLMFGGRVANSVWAMVPPVLNGDQPLVRGR